MSDARERFHAGIDVHANEGEIVRAVTSDKVSAPLAAQGFDTLSESLSVGPFTYVHVRVGRERKGGPLDEARAPLVVDEGGSPLRVRVRRGTRFEPRRPRRHGEPLQSRAPERGHARTRGQPAPAATGRFHGYGAADDRCARNHPAERRRTAHHEDGQTAGDLRPGADCRRSSAPASGIGSTTRLPRARRATPRACTSCASPCAGCAPRSRCSRVP